jgi:hypothetical protein
MSKFIFTFVLVLIAGSASSQISIGLVAGPQVASLRANRTDVDWKISYHAGAYVEYRMKGKLSIKADVLFSDKGYRNSFSSQKVRFHLQYFNVPVMVQYHFSKRFAVAVGGEFGVLISSYNKLWHNGEYIDTYDQKKYYGNPIDVGVGCGVSFQLNPKLGATVRFLQGLSNVLNKNAVEEHYAPQIGMNLRDLGYKYQNQVWQLSIYYSIHSWSR